MNSIASKLYCRFVTDKLFLVEFSHTGLVPAAVGRSGARRHRGD
jgi:hypothetical protein